MQAILKWIHKFSPTATFFKNGGCYWFAYLLATEFDGVIWYAPIEGHFVAEINHVFYDVEGQFIPSEKEASRMIRWVDLKQQDALWASHIARDCIHFRESDTE